MSDAAHSAGAPPRYSARPFPPYSYVNGFAPHPTSDPHGHMYGQVHVPATPLRPAAWAESDEYRYAIDLFNHGYYWEAHEAWESLWHAAGRKGPVATWLKALIKLAAAGVKAREGNPSGVGRHARRALELLAELRRTSEPAEIYCGLRLADVASIATSLDATPSEFTAPNPRLQFNYWLTLGKL